MHVPRSNPWMYFMVYGSYYVFSPKDRPFGSCNNIRIHLGSNILQKLPQKAISSQMGRIYKMRYLAKYKRSTCNFQRMLTPSNTNYGSSTMTSYQIQDGGRPPIWKSKIRNNSPADIATAKVAQFFWNTLYTFKCWFLQHCHHRVIHILLVSISVSVLAVIGKAVMPTDKVQVEKMREMISLRTNFNFCWHAYGLCAFESAFKYHGIT